VACRRIYEASSARPKRKSVHPQATKGNFQDKPVFWSWWATLRRFIRLSGSVNYLTLRIESAPPELGRFGSKIAGTYRLSNSGRGWAKLVGNQALHTPKSVAGARVGSLCLVRESLWCPPRCSDSKRLQNRHRPRFLAIVTAEDLETAPVPPVRSQTSVQERPLEYCRPSVNAARVSRRNIRTVARASQGNDLTRVESRPVAQAVHFRRNKCFPANPISILSRISSCRRNSS
jgi:hypothetical protein